MAASKADSVAPPRARHVPSSVTAEARRGALVFGCESPNAVPRMPKVAVADDCRKRHGGEAVLPERGCPYPAKASRLECAAMVRVAVFSIGALLCACSPLLESSDATFRKEEPDAGASGAVYLKAPARQAGSHFGDALAYDGQMAVIAASFTTIEGGTGPMPRAGASYVFALENGRWGQGMPLTIPDLEPRDAELEFSSLPSEAPNFLEEWPGTRVAIGPSHVAVSLLGDDGLNNATQRSGVVYVYDRFDLSSPPQVVRAPNPGVGDLFGVGLALHEDTLVVGAPGEASALPESVNHTAFEQMANDGAVKSGAVYVYTLQAGQFVFSKYLKSPTPKAGDFFGTSLALEDDVLAVGAPAEDLPYTGERTSLDANGAVYVFRRNPQRAWTLEQTLRPVAPAHKGFFGVSVSLSGSLLAIGAPGASTCDPRDPVATDDVLPRRRGAVYAVHAEAGGWPLEGTCISPAELSGGTAFGFSVSVGQQLVVGAPLNSSGDPQNIADTTIQRSGAAYVFSRAAARVDPTPRFVKAPVIDEEDGLGFTVAAGPVGYGVAVGAPREAGSHAGPTANLEDDGALEAGAVFIFTSDP